MRKYECVVILSSQLNDDQLKEEIKKIEGLVTTNKGINVTTESWGRKQLAFPLMKQSQGNYYCITFESMNSEVVSSLSSILRITESVLKFQMHRKNIPVRKFRGNPQRAEKGSRDWSGDEFNEEVAN